MRSLLTSKSTASSKWRSTGAENVSFAGSPHSCTAAWTSASFFRRGASSSLASAGAASRWRESTQVSRAEVHGAQGPLQELQDLRAPGLAALGKLGREGSRAVRADKQAE